MHESIDCLIIGGGISGRLIQLEMESRGRSTLVYDSPKGNHCTQVAAGLANPVVGKYFTIGWRAQEFFTPLADYYADLENRLDASFFSPKVMLRIIASAGEQNIWLSKAHQDKYKGFCSFENRELAGLNTHFGVLRVEQGGSMDTTAFLEACTARLTTRFEDFDYTYLDTVSQTYKSTSYQHIVFAEGYKVSENPYFNNLPVTPTKGELLEIEAEGISNEFIYLGSVYVQPIGENKWRIGSTYQQNDSSLNTTDMMREDLLSKLDKVVNKPYKVLKHLCGVRPASEDRKPIMGAHSSVENMYIVNGMGSKAVSMAPLLTTEMVDYILDKTPLPEEIDLIRFL